MWSLLQWRLDLGHLAAINANVTARSSLHATVRGWGRVGEEGGEVESGVGKRQGEGWRDKEMELGEQGGRS